MNKQDLTIALQALLQLSSQSKQMGLHLLEEKKKIEKSVKQLAPWQRENPLHFPVPLRVRTERLMKETQMLDDMVTQIKIIKASFENDLALEKKKGMAAMVKKNEPSN